MACSPLTAIISWSSGRSPALATPVLLSPAATNAATQAMALLWSCLRMTVRPLSSLRRARRP